MRHPTKKNLSDVHIHNPHEYSGGNVYIYYSGQGRFSHPGWRVCKKGKNLGNHWTDNGCKLFFCNGVNDRERQLEKAKEWAGNEFGITEWVKAPFGIWMDRRCVELRNQEIFSKLNGANNEKSC